jgi:hypothetical protein
LIINVSEPQPQGSGLNRPKGHHYKERRIDMVGALTNNGCGFDKMPVNIDTTGDVNVKFEQSGKMWEKHFQKSGYMECGVGWVTVTAPNATAIYVPNRKRQVIKKNVVKFWRNNPLDTVAVRFAEIPQKPNTGSGF